MIAGAQALHDVKVVIHIEDLCWPSSILFVNLDEPIDTTLIVRLRQVPIEVILPEHTGITFVREDEGVCQQFVVNDWTVANHIVVLDESHRLRRTIPH